MRAVVAREGRCVVQAVAIPMIQAREVRIRVVASAVNRTDTYQRRGMSTPPPGVPDILGLEAAGYVEAVGAECTRGFEQGDRVMAILAGGGYAEYANVDERLVMRVPDGMKLATAGGLPETWLTAYQLLHFLGEVRSGSTVLVHAISSGVGGAVVQLARAAGARVFGTAGTDAKVKAAGELGAEFVVNYKTEGDWSAKILEYTGGTGVDIILDCVGAQYVRGNAAVAGQDSRWVIYGLMSKLEDSSLSSEALAALLSALLRKRVRMEGSTLRTRSLAYKATLVESMWTHARQFFESGEFKVIIDSTYPLEEAQRAHEHMETNANSGKILLIVSADEACG